MKLVRAVAALLLCPALLGAPGARAADDVTIGTVGSASANIWPVFIGIKNGPIPQNDPAANALPPTFLLVPFDNAVVLGRRWWRSCGLLAFELASSFEPNPRTFFEG